MRSSLVTVDISDYLLSVHIDIREQCRLVPINHLHFVNQKCPFCNGPHTLLYVGRESQNSNLKQAHFVADVTAPQRLSSDRQDCKQCRGQIGGVLA